MLEMAVSQAEDQLASVRDLINATDSKCLQLMGLLVTVAILLGTAAAGVVATGGQPLYLAIIPTLGLLWVLKGIWTGSRALDGESPLLGMAPSHWNGFLDSPASKEHILKLRLKHLSGAIDKARPIARVLSERVVDMKSTSLQAVSGVVLAAVIFMLMDISGHECPRVAFATMPKIGGEIGK